MGIYDLFILPKTTGPIDLPVTSARIAELFSEFLRRYYEWKSAQLKEMIIILLLLIVGGSILSIPWLLPNFGMTLSLCLLLSFYIAVKCYIAINRKVSHLYVNVHVLQHHLVGKVEVGFCDHREPCHCAEEFMDYVLRTYNISLNKILS
ncbi:hypothetical protein ACPUYX_13025 [Desulfosporosinus sp. SYSU MS00001]|uniref:hypothetical protein n=1 Tax=Desulfosporosinus sp. SYSU MS00001 TaxID=3416284 RepID=UPI003CF0CC7B